MIIYFKVKPNTDLAKYDFVESKSEWVLWRGTRRMWVDKKDNLLHFNMMTTEMLSIFHQMIVDNVIEKKQRGWKPTHYHYIGLTDDEYEMIKEKRAKEL